MFPDPRRDMHLVMHGDDFKVIESSKHLNGIQEELNNIVYQAIEHDNRVGGVWVIGLGIKNMEKIDDTNMPVTTREFEL